MEPGFKVSVSAAPAPRRIGLGDSDRSRTIRAKRYIERQKNYEKIMTNRKKI